MDDSSKTRTVPRRQDRVKFSSTGNIYSRRKSFSSSSPSSSSVLFSGDSSVTSLHILGVPFSWEKLPGEPKELPYHRKTESAKNTLPLPPHRKNNVLPARTHSSPNSTRKKHMSATVMRDPFTAALIKCSEDGASVDGEHTGGESRKALRKSSIGLVNLYASCRNACQVSQSIVYLPRSVHGVASYNHLLLSTRHRRG